METGSPLNAQLWKNGHSNNWVWKQNDHFLSANNKEQITQKHLKNSRGSNKKIITNFVKGYEKGVLGSSISSMSSSMMPASRPQAKETTTADSRFAL